MKLRSVQLSDSTLSNVWRIARGVPVVPEGALPPTGYVACREDGFPLAAMWLYLSNSKLAYLAWPVTNPEAGVREASEALKLLFAQLCLTALDAGATYVVATSASRGLTKLLVDCGMKEAPKEHALLSLEIK